MTQALLIALVYYVCQVLDGIIGFQTITRPIILGTVTGMVCGDVKTGVIMGAELEAIYMGISGIGGVVASDYRTSTVMGVALTILANISIEQGLAIAVSVGALLNSLVPIVNTLRNLVQPFQDRNARAGDVKKFRRTMWFQLLCVTHTLNTIVLFLCVYFGADVIAKAFEVIPQFLLHGLSVAGGMLVVVGLCLTTQAIYSASTPFYVLLGFILVKYLNLPTLPVAILGVIIAYVLFTINYRFQQLENKQPSETVIVEGDDFYE